MEPTHPGWGLMVAVVTWGWGGVVVVTKGEGVAAVDGCHGGGVATRWSGSGVVMAAPTIPVSAKENLGDPIDSRMYIIHPEPVAVVTFPAAAVVRTQSQHGKAI
ncbi:hypothetical protein Tco_0499242 [Tanacetum coccineum]